MIVPRKRKQNSTRQPEQVFVNIKERYDNSDSQYCRVVPYFIVKETWWLDKVMLPRNGRSFKECFEYNNLLLSPRFRNNTSLIDLLV